MKIVFECIVCGSKDLTYKSGWFESFITSTVFASHKTNTYNICQYTNSCRCNACGTVFSQLRLEDDDLHSLYDDYMGKSYSTIRALCENNYADVLEKTVREQESPVRKTTVMDFIGNYLEDVNSIIDFGGDRGQHIPDINAKKYVYEIDKNKKLVDGVQHFKNGMPKADFAMCCNVLEHVAYPREIINHMKFMCNDDALCFIEVPNDLFTLADIHPVSFHEHQVFYTIESIKKLIDVIEIKTMLLDYLGTGEVTPVIYAVGRL